MSDTNQLADISHTIQVAVAPVFLLSALGTTLSVLTTRLGRIIDRARLLEGHFKGLDETEQVRARGELRRPVAAREVHPPGAFKDLPRLLAVGIAFQQKTGQHGKKNNENAKSESKCNSFF